MSCLLRNLISFCFSAVNGIPQMSYMDHLTNDEDEFDIFNGAPDLTDYTVLNLDLENGERLIFLFIFPVLIRAFLGTHPL